MHSSGLPERKEQIQSEYFWFLSSPLNLIAWFVLFMINLESASLKAFQRFFGSRFPFKTSRSIELRLSMLNQTSFPWQIKRFEKTWDLMIETFYNPLRIRALLFFDNFRSSWIMRSAQFSVYSCSSIHVTDLCIDGKMERFISYLSSLATWQILIHSMKSFVKNGTPFLRKTMTK